MAGRLRNTNTQPLNGSCRSTSLQTRARPSMPRRKSVGSTATRIRHLRRDLDHGTGFQKLRQSAIRSGGDAAFRWTRIFDPAVSSNSSVQSQAATGEAAIPESGPRTSFMPCLRGCGLQPPVLERVVLDRKALRSAMQTACVGHLHRRNPKPIGNCAGPYAFFATARTAVARPLRQPEDRVSF